MKLDTLCGNRAIKQRLSSALSHAYILAGPPGSGRRTLAAALAAALVCTGGGELPCGLCPACRKLAHGAHPDVIRVGEEGKDINVAQIRALRTDAYIRPNEAGRKVYLIEQAHTMNASAQNALLKLLEDGPAYAAFLLVADHAGALLQTVRSRCQLLPLSPVSPQEAQDYLTRRFPQVPAPEIQQAVRHCQGVLGRAVALLEGGGKEADALRAQGEQLAALLLGGDELTLLEHCVTLEGKNRTALAQLLDETVQILGQERTHLRRRLNLVELLKTLRAHLDFNVGPGHLAGALCAAAFPRTPSPNK